jgi:azurin
MNKSPSKSSDLNSRLPALGELRHISFSKDALVMAVKLYYAATKKSLPSGVVEGCEIVAAPDTQVEISICDDAASQLQKVQISAEIIGAAMINYCRKVNVPLPRDGKKSLLVSGDNLVLVVSVQAQPTKLFRTGTAEH